MDNSSFYESFSVDTVEKTEEGIKSYKLKRGFFIAGEFINDIPTRINVLPKPGTYKHAVYGEVKVTPERNKEFVDNFHNEVYQKLIPIDLEHETSLSGAVGYYEPGSGTVEEDGSVTIGVRWEDRGAKALSEGRFYYFSPMWFDKWQEPLSKKTYNNVLIGGALTTSPYFKDANLRPLYASELSVSEVHVDGPIGEDNKEASSTCPECGGTMGQDGKCATCSKKASEDIKEKKLEETKPEGVDPVAFNDLQRKFAEMEAKAATQAEELKKANEQIVRHANEARQRMFREIISGTNADSDGAKAFRGDISVHAGVLEALYAAEGEEAVKDENSLFQRYTAEMRSLSEIITDSEVLKTRGGTGNKNPKVASASARWDEAVAKVMSEQKVDNITALRLAAKSDPQLYRAQLEENYTKKGDED